MYYEFRRFIKRSLVPAHLGHFSGWALTRDGKIIETSHALAKFQDEKIEDLIAWVTDNKIEWMVLEKRP